VIVVAQQIDKQVTPTLWES